MGRAGLGGGARMGRAGLGGGVRMDVRDWPAVWLRDNCPCPDCRDPASGQKLFQITDLPGDLVVVQAEAGPESVTVVFGPDGHVARFGRDRLDELTGAGDTGGADGAGDRTEDGKRLWAGPGDLTGPNRAGGALPGGDWERYRADPAARAGGLGAVRRGG